MNGDALNGDVVVMLVGIVASLFLASRALKAQPLSFERKAGMAAAWAVIIGVLAFVLQRFGA
jgi:hypothetical protein